MANHRTNTVAVFIPTDDSNWRHLAVNVADIKRQRDVEAQIVVLDRTQSGVGHIKGATVIHVGADASLGEAYRAGLKHTHADLIAWGMPGVRSLPNRLSRQRTEMVINAGIDLVTCNMVLVDGSGCLTAEADPDKADEAPTPLWQAGTMVRREALARIGQSEDLPVELFLYMRLRAKGRTGHVPAALTVSDAEEFFEMIEDSLKEALAIRKISPPIAPKTDAFAQQRRSFDAHLASDGSVTDALDRMIREGTFDR
jgi:hypothetical protein